MACQTKQGRESTTGMELDAYRGKRILVTGGAGYLGTNLVQALAHIPCMVMRLSRTGARFMQVEGRADVQDIVGDVRNQEIWPNLLDGVDFVFHFAAQTSVYASHHDPQADLDINVLPMLHILETCRQSGQCPTILFSGTVTEAGIPTQLPVDESHPDNAITVYDFHKLMAEQYLKSYVGRELVRGTILRLTNVYGPGPPSSSADRGVLNQMIRRALQGERLTVFGLGAQIRDYIFIQDVIAAFLAAGAAISKTNGNHYVIGSSTGYTIAQAIQLVANQVAPKTGQQVQVVHVDLPHPQSPIEARNFVAATARFQSATGWQARWPLTKGIIQTVEWQVQQQKH